MEFEPEAYIAAFALIAFLVILVVGALLAVIEELPNPEDDK